MSTAWEKNILLHNYGKVWSCRSYKGISVDILGKDPADTVHSICNISVKYNWLKKKKKQHIINACVVEINLSLLKQIQPFVTKRSDHRPRKLNVPLWNLKKAADLAYWIFHILIRLELNRLTWFCFQYFYYLFECFPYSPYPSAKKEKTYFVY